MLARFWFRLFHKHTWVLTEKAEVSQSRPWTGEVFVVGTRYVYICDDTHCKAMKRNDAY